MLITKGKKKEKRKNYICTLRSTKTDTRKKNKETKSFSDPSHRSAWKLPVARCQIAHQPFLQHSNDEPKPGIQTWREQFSLIATQPCVQHLSTTQLNFSFHHGQDSEFVYFYCNRSYEDKHNWGDTRGIINSTWQATAAELAGTLHSCGAVPGWQEPWAGVLVEGGEFIKHKGNEPWCHTKVTVHELG